MKVIDAGAALEKLWVKQRRDPAVEVTELQLASSVNEDDVLFPLSKETKCDLWFLISSS